MPSDRRSVIDQVAAVLILQSFLDSRSAHSATGVEHSLPRSGTVRRIID
jgi:hypothetical protein